MKQLVIIILSVSLFTNCNSDKEKTCYLTGKVINRNSKTLVLLKQTEDFRYSGIEIPIDSSGNFNYNMNFQFVEAYELIFKDEIGRSTWSPILFFPDNDKIEFELFPIEKADSNKVIGSELSLKENAINQKLMVKYYDRYILWEKKMDSLMSINETNSIYYNTVSDSLKAIGKEITLFELHCAVKEQVNIYGYYKLLSILRIQNDRRNIAIDSLKKYCDLFLKEFPNHPYNEIAQFRLNGLTNMKVDGNYVDFTAKDSIGNSIILSNLITKNKLILIDLWSPWCGPCIRGSQKNVPIYEEFKDSGFAIIGVVGGIKNQVQFLNAIKKHDYPWTQLSEINDENKIWEKYNISYSGGSKFLVDNTGKIIAINPEPEEIKKLIMKQ
jgi:thiol-disulfide isomerase/thioredoxin